MKTNFGSEKLIFIMKIKQATALGFLSLTAIATASGCGVDKERKKANEAPPAERIERSENVDTDGCRTLTEAICVIPGDEGKCLAFKLVDVKECPEKR
ncbi:MAG: hypothetical protein RL189_74 [Pseudomonadota bacterium]|jgi:hypothetical protein